MFQLISAIALVAAAVFAGGSPLFRIKTVDCRLNHYPCSLSLEPALLTFIGKNIFSFSTASASRQLNAFDPTLTAVGIKKQLPGRLLVELSRRQPLALIKPEREGREYWLDKTGFVYPAGSATGQILPVILWPADQPLAEGESALSREAAGLINTLAAYYVSFVHFTRLPEGSYLVKTVAGPEAVLPGEGDFSGSVGSLQYLLSNLKIGKPLPAKIDLRFAKPILTY